MRIKSVYMRNFIDTFIYVSAVLFLIFVALPAYVFWLNSNDMSWQGALWFSQFAVSMCIAFFAAIILAMAPGSIRKFFNIISVMIFVFVFIRAFFAPVSFGVLEGVEINEVQILSDVSLWVSMVLLLVILFCALKYAKLVENIIQASTFVLVLLVVYIYSSYGNPSDTIDDSIVGKSHLSRFSNNSNIVVISFDSIQNDLLIELLSEYESLANSLDGFTLYTDVTGYAPNTNFSLLSTLAGSYIGAGDKGDITNNLWQIYGQATLPSVMAGHDYDVDVFNLPCRLAHNSTCMNTASVLPEGISADYRLTAYDVSILKVLPKSISWGIVQNLSGNKKGANKDEVTLISEDKAGHGFGMDKYTFKQMYEEIYLVDKAVFKFQHYLHTHQPIRFNKDCSYDVTITQDVKSAKSEIYCVLQEFNKFIIKLKETGIYNDALIVLTSDHGYESNIQPRIRNSEDYSGGFINNNGVWSASRYWPILLVKMPSAKGRLNMSSTPVSLVDIAPTIYSAANIDYCSGSRCDGTVLLRSEKLRRKVREAIFYVGGAKNLENKHHDTTLFLSKNIVGDAYNGVKDAMIRASLQGSRLACNQEVYFNKHFEGYAVDGMSGVEPWGRWSDAPKAKILFNINTDECSKNNLLINLKGFVTSKHRKQQAMVFLNEKQIGEIVIGLGNHKHKDFIFSIPSRLLKQDGVNVLEFYISNPVSPKSVGVNNDTRLLGLGFESMVFQ